MRDLGSVLIGILATSSMFVLSMGAYSLVMKRSAKALTFCLLCVAVAVYSTGYGMELVSDSLDEALKWNRVQYLGLPFLSPLWVMLAILHRGRERDLTPFRWFLLFFVPVATLIVRWSPALSHLHYAQVTMMRRDALMLLQIERGPWYMVSAAHMTGGILFAGGTYFREAVINRRLGLQAGLMIAASALPLASLWSLVTNLAPLGFDSAPFSLAASSIMLYLALFKYHFLDIVPLGHEKVFEWTTDGVLIVARTGELVEYNPAATRIFTTLNHRLIGKPYEMVFGEDAPAVKWLSESRQPQVTLQIPGGSSNYYQVRVTPLRDRSGNTLGSMITVSDITSQVIALRDMEKAASIDDLTMVANRGHALRLIKEALEKAREQGGPFCVLMTDLDSFKDINDQLGHQAGDVVLQQAARLCRENIRTVDILGRYGGDEFVMGLPGARLPDAVRAAERIRAAVRSQALLYEGRPIQFTLSIGVAGVDAVTHETVDTFLRHADKALYVAKNAGRDRIETISIR